MFAYPQQTRDITCPLSHSLMRTDDLCQLYGGRSYTKNVYFCDTCRGEFHSKYNPSGHCMTCGFDMCPKCYEAQKFVQISCPQNHPLLKVKALQKFSNYSGNRYKCNSCKGSFDSTMNDSAHCRSCKYDLCPNCLIAQSQFQPQVIYQQPSYQQQEHAKMSGNPSSMPFRQITCKNNHVLSPVNNLKQLHQDSRGGYTHNIFSCDTCRRNYTCSMNTFSHHCSACKFDMCSGCFEAQKTIKTSCPKSHPLFLVTAIKAFANYSSNNYRCNSCFITLDAARSPAAHCNSCNYDLCPNCLANSQSSQQQQVNFQPSYQQQQINFQPSYQQQEQIKRSGNPSSMMPFRQITCTNNHILNPVTDLKNLHPGLQGTYTLNMYVCDTCRRKYTCNANTPSYHCTGCKFDMCTGCYEAQKIIKTSCPKSHPLFLVTAIKAFANYSSNTYRCNTCLSSFDAAQNPPAHCKPCSYDLCPKCLANSQMILPNNDEREQMQRDGNILKQVTCSARHILIPVNNLKQLHPDSRGGYSSNIYVCDTCRLNFKCETDYSYHCQTCKFDLCPHCYHKDQKVNFDCSAGHPLYIVSNLKAFNQKTNSYVQNRYTCNSCRGSWDASMNPSCHCRLCSFDLCPNCFEAKKNQINQQLNNNQQQQQQYQMQQNYNQQQYQNQQNYSQQQYQAQQNYNQQQYQIQQNNAQQQYQNQQNYNQQYQMPQNDIQYQMQQNNVQQQQQYQMPQNNNQQYQMQNLQQNFANFSIQEPIKQSAPYNPEEAKNNQPEPERKELPEEMLCIVCLNIQRSHLFTPCMHLCSCGPCSFDLINQQKGCPMCRAPIQSTVKVFMS